jgi:hypothetical protein
MSVDVFMQGGHTWLQFGHGIERQTVPVEAGLLVSLDSAHQWCPDSEWMVLPDSTDRQVRLIQRGTGRLYVIDATRMRVEQVTIEADHFRIADWRAPCAA